MIDLKIQDVSTFPDKLYYVERGYFMPVITGIIKNDHLIFEKSNDWIITASYLKKESLKTVISYEHFSELSKLEKIHILTDFRKITDVNPAFFGESNKSSKKVISFDRELSQQDMELIKKEVLKYLNNNVTKQFDFLDNRLLLEMTSIKVDFADKSYSNDFANFCFVINSITTIRSINGNVPKFLKT